MIWLGLGLMALFGYVAFCSTRRIQKILALKLWLDSLCVVLLALTTEALHSESRFNVYAVYLVGHAILLYLLLGQVARVQGHGGPHE